MSATTNLGKVSVTPKGAWAITNTYEILDIVTSGGSSYLAKQDVPTGVLLTNTSYWIMIAEKGDGGEVTSASASISGGYGTPGVTVTAGGTAHERTLAFAFTNLRGEKGETGNGIDSVYKTGTSGLVDTYTILFTDGNTYEFEVNNGTASIDDTLTKSGWAADAKAVGDTKASIDGFYETMGVGVADNLTPYSEDSGATQSIPFIAQGTGCGNGESVVDTGSYLQFKKKLGNTVAVNQGIPDFIADNSSLFNYYNTDSRSISDGILSIVPNGTMTSTLHYGIGISGGFPTITGRKYWCFVNVRSTKADKFRLRIGNNMVYSADTSANTWATICVFVDGNSNGNTATVYAYDDTLYTTSDRIDFKCWYVSDASIWYGSTDRIPSDLLAHPENWGRYYAGSLAYNAGTLDSADGTVLKSIGRNVWDEQTELGSIDLTTGANSISSSLSRSEHYFKVIPNSIYCIRKPTGYQFFGVFYDRDYNAVQYNTATGTDATVYKSAAVFHTNATNNTFLVPANACYMRLRLDGVTTYNHDITISLYYPGESGYDQYYPYSVLAEVDTGSEVLRSAGSVADVKTPDGTITRRVGTVDLGTLEWTYDTTNLSVPIFKSSVIAGAVADRASVYLCAKYTYVGAKAEGHLESNDKAFARWNSSNSANIVVIRDDSYTDAAAFKTAMSGVILHFELATPTTEQGTAFAENIPCDDFGSLMWTQTKGIPQGNEIFYPVDYKASIDTLYNRVEGDMGAIVIDSQLEVVADRIPEAPSEDGTYTLKATVSSGTKTYSWVADE